MLVTLDGNTAADVIKAFQRRLKRGPESPRKIGNFDSPHEGFSALTAAVIKGA